MFELSLMEWIIVAICALFIGFSKAGLPNLVIFVVTILMFIFPARESVGILLPMLMVGDVFAVIYYRRTVIWRHLFSLLPGVIIGILFGYFILSIVTSEQLQPMIGIIVLLMIGLHILSSRMGTRLNEMLPKSKIFATFMGIMGGFTTMVGNAAGAVMTIYLIVQGLPKREFIGTSAWFFLMVNAIKVPFYLNLGLITQESFTFNLTLAPFIILGAFLGARLLPYIPLHIFRYIVLGLAAVGGISLII